MNKVEDFLSDFSKSSRMVYRTPINLFFKVIGKEEATYLDNPNKEEIEDDMNKFVNHILENYSPYSRSSYFTKINQLIEENNIFLDRQKIKKWKRRLGKSYAIFEEIVPSKEELKLILSFANVRGKHIFLLYCHLE